MTELITNEWLSADLYKPYKNRLVLCRFKDGHYNVCYYNGIYWCGQHGIRLMIEDRPTHFYIFDKFNENELI